ncbi:hypothetical protein ACSBLW_05195 [Thioclava sp. FR2]
MYARSENKKGTDFVGDVADAVSVIISQLKTQTYLDRLMNRLERDQ